MINNVKIYQYFFGSQRITLQGFICAGFLIGLIFPTLAIFIDVSVHHFTFSFSSLIYIHQLNPVHFVVDSAPLVLSATAYIIGRAVQCKEQQARESIVISEKKFSNILRYNPDAVFLVRTSDFVIEQHNKSALQLCDIDKSDYSGTQAKVFFSGLNKSLSVLK